MVSKEWMYAFYRFVSPCVCVCMCASVVFGLFDASTTEHFRLVTISTLGLHIFGSPSKSATRNCALEIASTNIHLRDVQGDKKNLHLWWWILFLLDFDHHWNWLSISSGPGRVVLGKRYWFSSILLGELFSIQLRWVEQNNMMLQFKRFEKSIKVTWI